MTDSTSSAQPTKYAYWVNLTSFGGGFLGVIKVDFKVERAADLEKLKLAITRGWTPSQSWNSMIIAWTPMPGENEYVPVTAAATPEPSA